MTYHLEPYFEAHKTRLAKAEHRKLVAEAKATRISVPAGRGLLKSLFGARLSSTVTAPVLDRTGA